MPVIERTAREPQAFATLYRRHERLLLRFLMSRCRDAELTADLTELTGDNAPDVTVICVPTPLSESDGPDLTAVKAATESAAKTTESSRNAGSTRSK